MSVVVEEGTGRIMAWKDSIPLHYEYTAGTAGEAFLRGLRDGRIIASKCTTCGELRVPPRAYCLECGARTRTDVELLHSGMIVAISRVSPGAHGATPPSTFGFVVFQGVAGGLLHKILHEGRRAPHVGEAVMPSFVPVGQRKGSILDLAGFKTAARTPRGND